MKIDEILIVGAGLSGAVIGRELAEAGCRVTVIDERDHAGGHCHSHTDPETGVMVHTYGPHVFHTDDEGVWSYIHRFAAWEPYINRVKTVSRGRVYSLPVNLMTINQFFGRALGPAEARRFVSGLVDRTIAAPANFEEQALAFMGRDLYQAFFYGYTKKQWGREPRELPAAVLKRLPLRFNYDDNYFSHQYQAVPRDGYGPLFDNLLRHPNLTLELGRAYEPGLAAGFDQVFYSGPVDRYFNFQAGPLPYRTVDFEWFRAEGDFQGTAVMNCADEDQPHTRVVEYRHFAPWSRPDRTVCSREVPRESRPGDSPYYPVRFAGDDRRWRAYAELAGREPRVTFVGRLGSFRYIDMDVAVREALNTAALYRQQRKLGRAMPAFAN